MKNFSFDKLKIAIFCSSYEKFSYLKNCYNSKHQVVHVRNESNTRAIVYDLIVLEQGYKLSKKEQVAHDMIIMRSENKVMSYVTPMSCGN